LKIANIVKDKDILSLARHWAKKVLVSDPKLENTKHQAIAQTYIKMGKYKNIWNYIS
jgi:ATP-dependent DNA helicase RecG